MKFNFAENKTVKDLNAVPTDFQGLYTDAGDGTFTLASDHPGVTSAVAAVIRLNEALTSSRAEAKANKKAVVDLSPLAEFGDSPEAIKTAVQTKLEELQAELAKGGKAKINLDKIKEEIAQAHAQKLTDSEAQNTALQGQLYDMMVTTQATTAVVDAKGNPKLLMPFIKNQVQALQEDGQFKVLVVDSDKERRYSGTTGQPMTIAELVQEMKGQEDFGALFNSEVPNGPGIKNTQRKVLPKGKTELSANEKIAQGLAKGQYTK